jgi:dTDP-4-amino-4,6-dideoxygalactose transaminase
MSELALLGGKRVRTQVWPAWPMYSAADRDRLLQVFDSRNWGGYPFPNHYALEFAEQFAAHHGAAYGCAVANGTVALVIALKAAGLGYGDEVLVPAYTWDGTATAVLDAGGIPVFVDVDPDTYCLDAEAARRAITPRTKAILPVHLAMRFADMDALTALAREHDLLIIEDCAHMHGGAWRGRGAGSMGDLGCFSMQSSKLMTAGEGGMVITSRLDCFERVESIVNCGRASRSDQFRSRPLGGNFRITELQAALLVGQLERLNELGERRARNAKRLSDGLAQRAGVRPLPPQAGISTEAIYCYVFQYQASARGVSRDMFVAALEAEGVPADGRFYEPVYRSALFPATPGSLPQLKEVHYSECFCPVAERAAYDEAVWLPQFLLLGHDADVDDVLRGVDKVLAGLDELSQADPALAGVKAMSRAERPRMEKKNY